MTLTPYQLQLLRHTIGLDSHAISYRARLTGDLHRNYAFLTIGGLDEAAFIDMETRGLVEAGGVRGDGRYWRATSAGIKHARADERQRRRDAGLRDWVVSFPVGCAYGSEVWSETVLAKTRAAARWSVVDDLIDNYRMPYILKHIRVRVAVDRRRKAT